MSTPTGPFKLALPHVFHLAGEMLVGLKKVLQKHLVAFVKHASACFCVAGLPFMAPAQMVMGEAAFLGALANIAERPPPHPQEKASLWQMFLKPKY